MNWLYREVQIEDDKTLADSGTIGVDLDVKDPITELMVRYYVANEAAAQHNSAPELTIAKIELVDGGRSLMSAYGETAIAEACFDTGRWPHVDYCEVASYGQYVHIPIRFGRYLGDPEFGFDASRLTNPQLKFTWVDSASYLTGYTKLGVTAKVMQGGPRPSKCLLWQDVETFTSVGSGVKRVEMPVDRAYRRMLIRAYVQGSLPWSILTHFKFDIGMGEIIPFDLAGSEFEDVCQQHFGPYDYRALIAGDYNETRECWMAGSTSVQSETSEGMHLINTWCSGNPYYYVWTWEDDGDTAQADQLSEVWVRGMYPHNCFPYQFGRPDDPETWFNPTAHRRVDLHLTQGVAAAECTVAVQVPVTL